MPLYCNISTEGTSLFIAQNILFRKHLGSLNHMMTDGTHVYKNLQSIWLVARRPVPQRACPTCVMSSPYSARSKHSQIKGLHHHIVVFWVLSKRERETVSRFEHMHNVRSQTFTHRAGSQPTYICGSMHSRSEYTEPAHIRQDILSTTRPIKGGVKTKSFDVHHPTVATQSWISFRRNHPHSSIKGIKCHNTDVYTIMNRSRRSQARILLYVQVLSKAFSTLP
jgi:hypothetical protein